MSDDLDLPDVINRRHWRMVMRQRRIGRFEISTNLIDDEPHAVQEALRDMIIVRAEQMYDTMSIEYMAISDKFEELALGHRAPRYIARLTRHREEKDGEVIWTHAVEWVKDQ